MAGSGPRLGWGPIAFLLHLALIILLLAAQPIKGESSTRASSSAVLVVGSINVDIIIPVDRLPSRGETVTARNPAAQIAVGGKGANQAVAAARLAAGTGRPTRFVCRFGNDSNSKMLEAALIDAGVDISGAGRVGDSPSGQGIVLLETDGSASSIVLGGSNIQWPRNMPADHLMVDTGVILLQREIPEHVNLAVAKAAKLAGVPVILDVGGEDRVFTKKMLALVEYLAPNESELQRITGALVTDSEEAVVAAARSLIARGAHNVLVTLAERGSLLVKEDGEVLRQEAVPVPGGVIDGTAAGDAFRAAFAVALVEKRPLQECLWFASAAGAVAVSRMGAVPSLPTRIEVLGLISLESAGSVETVGDGTAAADALETAADERRTNSPLPASFKKPGVQFKGDDSQRCNANELNNVCTADSGAEKSSNNNQPSLKSSSFPLKFASRLNSMQARPDLATGKVLKTKGVLGWIARQGKIQGLDLVDFNYPQHFNEGVSQENIKAALMAASLSTGAVCIRFPPEYRAGAFTNPEERLRASAIDLAVQGCKVAAELGARDLIVWSPCDGYDYNFQINYPTAWKQTVDAYQQLADSCPSGVRVSLEFKPTDESTRFSIVPSTGAALLLVRDVDRPNFGLTLDVGHLLMAGENPAQSIAMVGSAGKLFGMQLNDAHVKLGAEDGLAFGSVGASAALELVAWLRKVQYGGHVYYDTFPRNEDPVREAEYNIRRFKALWARAERLEKAGIDNLAAKHDAMAILELLEADENGSRLDKSL